MPSLDLMVQICVKSERGPQPFRTDHEDDRARTPEPDRKRPRELVDDSVDDGSQSRSWKRTRGGNCQHCREQAAPQAYKSNLPMHLVERQSYVGDSGTSVMRERLFRGNQRFLAEMMDWIVVAFGGIAAVAVLDFNQSSKGPFPPSPDNNPQLPTILPLVKSFRYPGVQAYVVAVIVYSATAIFQMVQQPPFWAETGLVAMVISMAAGFVLGERALIDTLVAGGFLSLLLCKLLVLLPAGRKTRSEDGRMTSRQVEQGRHPEKNAC